LSGFLNLEHGTTLETHGFGEVSRRGEGPFLRPEPGPTAGDLEPAGGNRVDHGLIFTLPEA